MKTTSVNGAVASSGNNDDDDEGNASEAFKLSDFNNNSTRTTGANNRPGEASAMAHRSIRLRDMQIMLTETPGILTRNLHELIKAMNASSSVVNPSSFHSAFCKRYIFSDI